jgi:1-phosphatidylinositol-3-phosphate 5-kinase
MLGRSRAEKRQAREPKLTDAGEAFMPDDRSVAESTSTWGLVNMDANDSGNPTEEMRVSSSKLPWVICESSALQSYEQPC